MTCFHFERTIHLHIGTSGDGKSASLTSVLKLPLVVVTQMQ